MRHGRWGPDKAIVLKGECDNEAVVVKICLRSGEWHDYFLHELATYRAFKKNPPKLPTSRPLLLDEKNSILILSLLPGTSVSTERYPTHSLPQYQISQILALLEQITHYQRRGAISRETVQEYYYSRVRRHHDIGILHLSDVAIFDDVLTSSEWRPQFCHGDPNPTNFISSGNEVSVLDWELSTFLLPFSDHGLAWTFLINDKRSQEQIEAACIKAGPVSYRFFLLNALLGVARSIRTHTETEASNPLRKNLPILRVKLEELRDRIAVM